MMALIKLIKKNWSLICIIGLALFLRFWGLNYGLPYFLIDDERTLVYGALKMGELKTLIPALHAEEFKILYYAPLMSYIYLFFITPFVLIQYFTGHFANLAEIANYFVIDPGPIWLIARAINALIGAASVFLLFLIGKKAFNNWVGLISASFLTTSFLHIQFSHFTRLWGPSLFIVLLVMFLSLCIWKSPKIKYYLWMGIVGGLGFGTNYILPVTLFIFLMAHFATGKNSILNKLKDRKLWLTIVVFVLLAGIFTMIFPQLFVGWTGLGRLEGALAANRSFSQFLFVSFAYMKALLFYEPLVLIFSLVGLAFFYFKSKGLALVFLTWPVFWLLITYFILHGGYIGGNPHLHYILVIIPWLILPASYAVYQLAAKLPSVLRIILLILVFAYPAAASLQYVNLLGQKDTRILAKEWVEENIPQGSRIVSNWNYINPIPTKESILLQEELDEDSIRALDKALLKTESSEYPQPSYNLLKLAYVDKEKWIIPQDYQYFLVFFWKEENLLPEEKRIMERGRLIAEFKQSDAGNPENINAGLYMPVSTIFYWDRLGPIVRIYEL